MRDFWQIVRRYLFGWGIAFLVLCVISLVKNWGTLVEAMSSSVASLLELGFGIFITIYVIIRLLRSLFS